MKFYRYKGDFVFELSRRSPISIDIKPAVIELAASAKGDGLMFDQFFSQVSALIGGEAAESVMSAETLLNAAGVDLAELQGLPIEQVTSLLEAAGIDPSTLAEGQLTELLGSLSIGDGGES